MFRRKVLVVKSRMTGILLLLVVSVAVSGQATPPLAINTAINGPTAPALDKEGHHLYVIESITNKVLRIDLKTRTITDFAGNGARCCHKDGIKAVKASLDFPESLALDSSGSLFIGEIAGFVRRVDAVTGIITTVAGDGHGGTTVEGVQAPIADFWGIDGLAIDTEGNIFVADVHQSKIFKIDARTKAVTTFAGNGKQGYAGDGFAAVQASFRFAGNIVFDARENLIISDYGNCRIRMVDHATGIINTVAVVGPVNADGSCANPSNEPGPYPSDPAVDSFGNVYFVQGALDFVKKIDHLSRMVSLVAGSGKRGFCGDGGPATQACLDNASGLVLDSDGNLYISEFVNNRIRRVDAVTHVITTIGGNGLPHRIDIQL